MVTDSQKIVFGGVGVRSIALNLRGMDTGKTDLHVLVGQLISPCMLGTLKNKAEIHEDEGSRR